jgi:long-chain fatty acid transport protein
VPKTRLGLACFAAGSVLIGATGACASGFGASEISVKGMGRANSGEVADGGVESLWWNPASIARSGREVSLGLQYRNYDTHFTDTGSTVTRPIPPAGLTTPTGGASRVGDGGKDLVAPYAAAAMPIGERFAVGLSVSRPFLLQTEFGADSWTRYDTVRSQIAITDIQLTGAMQATDWLDLGVGIDAAYNDAYLDQAYPNLNPTAPDGLSHLEGDGWAYGWTVGAHARFDRLSVGVSYRSSIDHKLDGKLQVSGLQAPLDTANFSAPSTASFSTPWTATLGVRWAATPASTLNAQVVRSGWSKYDAIDVAFAGQGVAVLQNFKDTTAVAVGVDHELNSIWTLRAGVQFDPTPTPDDLREPGIFDADRWIYAAGASVKLDSDVTLHGALSYTDLTKTAMFDNDVFYGGTAAQTTARTRGTFSGHGLSAALGVNWRF